MQNKLDSQITFLGCSNLSENHEFYTKIMGFPLILDQGKCRIYRSVGQSYLGFCQREGEVLAQGVILTLLTQDVDGYYQLIQERGGSFEKSPSFNPAFQIYHCFLRDPNNYLIEIQRFEDPRWQQYSS
ncbi:MAG: VOC family protein [SAR324 cluster bacterium]|nr:VOC family protein [SAR324 cluster bacterium]